MARPKKSNQQTKSPAKRGRPAKVNTEAFDKTVTAAPSLRDVEKQAFDETKPLPVKPTEPEAATPPAPIINEPVFDNNTVFEVMPEDVNARGIISFDKGAVNAGIGIKFQRITDVTIKEWGLYGDKKTKFDIPLNFPNKEKCDHFFDQLVFMVKKRTDPSLQAPMAKAPAPKKPVEVPNGPLTVHDIDQLTASLPDPVAAETPEKVDTLKPFHPAQYVAPMHKTISPQINNNKNGPSQLGGGIKSNNGPKVSGEDQLRAYATSIYNAIMGSFQVRLQGGMPVSQIQKEILNKSVKQYSYKLQESFPGSAQWFIEISYGEITLRIPENPQHYLPTK